MRIFSAILFAIALLGSSPAEAARRVALVLESEEEQARDLGGRDQTAIGQSASGLADILAGRFGFDVLRFVGGRSKDPAREISEFRDRVKGSEFAIIFFSGPVEHDRDGTYLLTGATPGSGEVNLNQLLSHVVSGSDAGLAIIESTSATAVAGRRATGAGRMPQIPNKLSIWIAARGGAKSLRLAASVGTQLGRNEIVPSSLLMSVRDQLYLESAGLTLVRSFGSLPEGRRLGLAPDREDLLSQLRARAKRICEQPLARAPEETERKLVEHYARSAGYLRVAAFRELDTFTLDALHRELPESGRCPLLPPAAPTDENESQPETRKKPDGTAALTPPSSTQPEKLAPSRPGGRARDDDDLDSDDEKAKSRKNSPSQPEKAPQSEKPAKKQQAREREDDTTSRPKKRDSGGERTTEKPRERPSSPPRERESPPARAPAPVTPSRGINVPM